VNVPFNRPQLVGNELAYIRQAVGGAHLSGDGQFTQRCHRWLEAQIQVSRALLTHSCSTALDMAAILCDVRAGDEVIMPAFAFSSTANAVVLRGATPVFVDIRPDTLNLDERQLPAALTPRTKAVMLVHYAGVACEMEPIVRFCTEHRLDLIEDAAHALPATHHGRALGTFGRFAALSFHETKNVISGEGGALLVNDPADIERAEIVREKGTDRSRFLRGEVDKYTWTDVGSSYLPSEITAAFLFAQLERADWLTRERRSIWDRYHTALASLEAAGLLRRPTVPAGDTISAHLYYLLLDSEATRVDFIQALADDGIHAVSHYVPLDTSPAGLRFGRRVGELPVTHDVGARLVRLPLWPGMRDEVDHVIGAVEAFFRGSVGSRPGTTPS